MKFRILFYLVKTATIGIWLVLPIILGLMIPSLTTTLMPGPYYVRTNCACMPDENFVYPTAEEIAEAKQNLENALTFLNIAYAIAFIIYMVELAIVWLGKGIQKPRNKVLLTELIFVGALCLGFIWEHAATGGLTRSYDWILFSLL